jgi:phage tail-like protein
VRPDVQRDRPCSGAHFLVSFGSADAHAESAGFSEVIFPTFRLEAEQNDPAPSLLLKRGVSGGLDLYAWWDKARRGKAPQRRTVKVELLAEDQRTVVVTWRFRNARPLSLAYSRLNALEGSVVIETLELAFDRMEMA